MRIYDRARDLPPRHAQQICQLTLDSESLKRFWAKVSQEDKSKESISENDWFD